jgi:hypothetical protein
MSTLNYVILVLNIILAISQFLREGTIFFIWFKEQKYEDKINKRFNKFKGTDLFHQCPNIYCTSSNYHKDFDCIRIGNKYIYFKCKKCGAEIRDEIEYIKNEYKKEDD